MKCPKCSYPNQQGVTYCSMCYEVFNRSAADRYLHAQRRARMQEQKDPGEVPETPAASTPTTPSVPLFSGIRLVSESLMRIGWKTKFHRLASETRAMSKTYAKEIALAAAIIGLGSALVILASPTKRLQIFGGRLDYSFRSSAGYPYLITFGTELKSWSERGGRLDTPLDSGQRAEIGNVFMKASSHKPVKSRGSKQKIQDVVIQPKEWIVTQSGRMPQNISLNHPSLKMIRTGLNPHGEIVRRDANYSTRMGRAVTFIMPRWPSEAQRAGDTWYEPVGWVQTLGDWKIFWRGQLHWKLIGYKNFEHATAAHLVYHAEVTPAIWDSPAWAKNVTKRITYTGTGDGEAYFDTRKRLMISNTFSQDGALTIPIDNVYRIPADQRVGRMPRQRRSPEQDSGRILLQIKEKLDVHKR